MDLPPASDSLSPPGPGGAAGADAADGADRPVVLPGATQDPRIVTRKLGGRVGRRPSVNPLNPLAEHAASHLMDSDAECAPTPNPAQLRRQHFCASRRAFLAQDQEESGPVF